MGVWRDDVKIANWYENCNSYEIANVDLELYTETWELQTNMKISNWYENCKLIWEFQSNSCVPVYGSYVDICNFHMRHSGNENLFLNRMFWFDCGVDDKNSTKQSLAKPSTIHILIPIPMLTQSDSYFKTWFICSLWEKCRTSYSSLPKYVIHSGNRFSMYSFS
jgi:hypothetical protein